MPSRIYRSDDATYEVGHPLPESSGGSPASQSPARVRRFRRISPVHTYADESAPAERTPGVPPLSAQEEFDRGVEELFDMAFARRDRGEMSNDEIGRLFPAEIRRVHRDNDD